MQITAYEFGRIEIDGRAYDKDVIISPDRVLAPWWREEGHRLHIEDLADILPGRPEILVIGTGYYGRMQVPDETRAYLEKRGMEVRVSDTRDAVRAFNALGQGAARVVAALHLTC